MRVITVDAQSQDPVVQSEYKLLFLACCGCDVSDNYPLVQCVLTLTCLFAYFRFLLVVPTVELCNISHLLRFIS